MAITSTPRDGGAVCAPGSSLTYETFGRTFMTAYCTRCHSSDLEGGARWGASAIHDFDTVQQVRRFAAQIDRGAAAGTRATNMAMPIGSPTPTAEERAELGEWLACGAP